MVTVVTIGSYHVRTENYCSQMGFQFNLEQITGIMKDMPNAMAK